MEQNTANHIKYKKTCHFSMYVIIHQNEKGLMLLYTIYSTLLTAHIQVGQRPRTASAFPHHLTVGVLEAELRKSDDYLQEVK